MLNGVTKKDIDDMIAKLKEEISWAEYDYELSDQPGFRDPVDKRQDTAIINQCTAVIKELEKLKEVI